MPQTFIVLITGHLLFEYAKQAIDSKVDYFITKPYASADLIKIINEIRERIASRVDDVQQRTVSYLNNWKRLKNLVTQIYNGTAPPADLENELLCADTKPARTLKIKRLCFYAKDPAEKEPSENKTAVIEDFGSFDSYQLSSFLVKAENGLFIFIIFYSSENDLQLFIDDFNNSLLHLLDVQAEYSMEDYENIHAFYHAEQTARIAIEYVSIILHKSAADANSYMQHIENLGAAELQNLLQLILHHLNKNGISTDVFPPLAEHTQSALLNYIRQLPEFTNVDSLHVDMIRLATHYIQKNYQNSSLSLSEIADVLHISPDYLGKLFKLHLNINYTEYLTNYRLEKAKELLKSTNKSISYISNAVGYNHVHYFRQIFKNKFGCTPLTYRKLNLIDDVYEK